MWYRSNLNAYHLGYVLGPRITGGRVGKSSHGASLLLSNNPKEVYKLASIRSLRKERQYLESETLKKTADLSNDQLLDPVIILSGKNWHEE